MANIYLATPTAIRFKAVGVADSEAGTSITGVEESFAWNEDDPTINAIKDQFSDNDLFQTSTAGSKSFTFDIAGLDLTVLATLTGGTYATNKYTSPSIASSKYFKWVIVFGSNAYSILVPNGMTVVKLAGDSLKTNPLKGTVTVTLAGGYVIQDNGVPASW